MASPALAGQPMLPLQKPLSLMKGTRNSAKIVTTTNSVRAGDQRVAIRNRQACQGRAWGDLAIPSTLPTLLGTTTSFGRLQHQLGDSTLTNSMNDDTKPPQVVLGGCRVHRESDGVFSLAWRKHVESGETRNPEASHGPRPQDRSWQPTWKV